VHFLTFERHLIFTLLGSALTHCRNFHTVLKKSFQRSKKFHAVKHFNFSNVTRELKNLPINNTMEIEQYKRCNGYRDISKREHLFISPVLQFGLSLYFCDRQTSTTAAFSTAIAIASRTDPATNNEKARDM
jgi:hypothetical protein